MMYGLATHIVFAVLALFGSMPAEAQPSTVNVTAFQPYLPVGSLDHLLPVLARAAARHGHAAASPFISAESSVGAPEPVVNQVSLSSEGGVDVWLMRQRQTRRDGNDPQHWSLVGIIVDRGHKPQQAYFLEFAPEPVAAGALPQPIAPRVQCFRCHANGPRFIRPEVPAQPPVVDDAQRHLLAAWNARIRDSGVVTMFVPPAATEADQLKDNTPVANETIPFAFCTDCHGGAAAVRGALRRQHLGSIEFLLAHRDTDARGEESGAGPDGGFAMPIDDTLSAAEKSCLQAWLRAVPLAPVCSSLKTKTKRTQLVQGMKLAKDKEATAEAKWLAIEAEQSALTVNVRTNLSQFTISSLHVSGTLSGPECNSSIIIGLADVRTGIRVRDRHLHEQIVDGYETARVTLDPANCLALREVVIHGGATKLALVLTWRGATHVLLAAVSFIDGVATLEVPLTLTDFGITPPAVFGLRVAPIVDVVGRIQLRTPSMGQQKL